MCPVLCSWMAVKNNILKRNPLSKLDHTHTHTTKWMFRCSICCIQEFNLEHVQPVTSIFIYLYVHWYNLSALLRNDRKNMIHLYTTTIHINKHMSCLNYDGEIALSSGTNKIESAQQKTVYCLYSILLDFIACMFRNYLVFLVSSFHSRIFCLLSSLSIFNLHEEINCQKYWKHSIL